MQSYKTDAQHYKQTTLGYRVTNGFYKILVFGFVILQNSVSGFQILQLQFSGFAIFQKLQNRPYRQSYKHWKTRGKNVSLVSYMSAKKLGVFVSIAFVAFDPFAGMREFLEARFSASKTGALSSAPARNVHAFSYPKG